MADSPPNNANFDSKMEALREITLTDDDPRFSPDEMIACSRMLAFKSAEPARRVYIAESSRSQPRSGPT